MAFWRSMDTLERSSRQLAVDRQDLYQVTPGIRSPREVPAFRLFAVKRNRFQLHKQRVVVGLERGQECALARQKQRGCGRKELGVTGTVLPFTSLTPVALAATDGLPEKENVVNLAASGTGSVDWGKEELRAPEMMTPLLMLMVEVMKYGSTAASSTTTHGCPCCSYSELALAMAAVKAAVTSTATMLLPGTMAGGGSRLLSSCTMQPGLSRARSRDAFAPAVAYDAAF